MKKSRKKTKNAILTALTLGVLIASGVYGLNSAFAKYGEGNLEIANKIAERFGLNKEEVQAVFDENRQEQRQKVEANFEQRLNQLQDEGKITEQQKEVIIAKKNELEVNNKNREEFKNLSPEERRAKADQNREEIEKWATENGINLEEIKPFGVGKGFKGKNSGRGIQK
jgi:uncharacterized membrane protein YhiD involved in acid resistance